MRGDGLGVKCEVEGCISHLEIAIKMCIAQCWLKEKPQPGDVSGSCLFTGSPA